MLKKILTIALTAAICLSVAGCKAPPPTATSSEGSSSESSSTESGEDSSTVAEEYTPEDGASLLLWTGDLEFGKTVAEQFKAKTGIEVTVEEIGFDSADKMALDGPAGKGADVFISPHDKVQYLVSSGLAVALDPQIQEAVTQTINPVAVQTVTKDQKMYGVPVSIETVAMFYNKDAVKGEPAKTFEQIFEESKAYNKPKDNKYWFLSSIANGNGAFPFLSMNGVELFGKDGTDNDNPGFKSEGFVKAMETLTKFKEIIPISSGDLTMAASGFLEESFKTAKTAYYINGPWAVKGLKDANVNFGVYPLPTFEGKTLKPMAFVQNAHVSAYSKYPKAAQLLAEYLVSEEAATALYEKAVKITSRNDITNVKGLNEDEYLSPILEQFKNAVPMPTATRVSYYWTISENVFGAVFDGKLTPEKAAEKAQADFDALVASE